MRTALLACGLTLAGLAATASAQPPVPRLSATLAPVDVPWTLQRGEASAAVVEVRNAGTEAWPAGGPVRLAYHWQHADGADAGADSPRTPLAVSVPPGGSAPVCALVVAPGRTGAFRLHWEMVKEGEAWFGAVDPASAAPPPITVRDVATENAGRSGTGRVASWLLVTLAHVLVSVWWAARARDGDLVPPAIDGRVFDAILFAVGTLQGVLFLASATTGLPHPHGVLWLAAFDTVVAVALIATRTRGPAPARADGSREARTTIVLAALQAAGVLGLTTLAVSWLRAAARSLHISGSDAVHYHAPHAVNLALGTSPFDLLPTPHLYPMGTSLLGAWFILPFGDPLLIDAAMLCYAVLFAAALARAFSAVTGRPGFAWTPWLLLALLAAPLFQASTLFSSDLPFTAAFAAASAQLLAIGAGRRPISPRDALRTGLAFGLLCGVKTTGAPATALLLAVAATVWSIRRWRGGSRRRLPGAPVAAIALAGFLAGGGSWLVRNELRYGSPVAPNGLRLFGLTIFPGETIADAAMHYSVASDLARPGGYPLGARLSYFTRRLVGPVAGPAAILLLVLVVDVVVTRARAPADGTSGRGDPRIPLILGFAAVSIVLTWLLVQAPWTSLEWTDGLALRYALPLLAGVAFLAFLGLFPRQFAWYDDPVTAAAGGAMLAGGATTLLIRSQAALPATLPDAVPGLDGLSLAVAAAVVAAAGLAWRWRAVRYVVVLLLAAGSWPAAARLAAHDAALLAGSRQEQERQVRCAVAGVDTEAAPARTMFAALVADERRRGWSCHARRVFLASRFDVPLDLQTLPYSTRIFDARGVGLAELGPRTGRCDYTVVATALLETDRGGAAIRGLQAEHGWRSVAERGGFAAFAPRP